MAGIEWRTSFSVGVDAMDQQHKKLFGIINELHEAMRKSKGEEAIKKILPGLVEYTKTHFSVEEKLQKDVGFPGLAAHHELHQKLIQQVCELLDKVKAGKPVSTVNVGMFLNDWLINHIQKQDKQYGAFISERKLAGAAK